MSLSAQLHIRSCRCYEGEALSHLLKIIKSRIASARLLDQTLPEKIWVKQQFSVGVNDVTRVLERMCPQPQYPYTHGAQVSSVSLQVPVISIKDKKAGSLRLGELVHLKTAIAIGIKAKGNAINQLFEEIIHGSELKLGTDV
ncbi:hypothetical protein RJ641_017124, partial [Dillenia turbinata]